MKIRSQQWLRWQVWWPVAAILAVGAGLSVALWQSLQAKKNQVVLERLNQQAQLFAVSTEQRLYAYGDMAYAMQPLLEKNMAVASQEFASSTLLQSLPARYQGVESLSLARRWSAQDYLAQRGQRIEQVPSHLRVPEHEGSDVALSDNHFLVIDEVWPPSRKQQLVSWRAGSQKAVHTLLQELQHSVGPRMSAPLQLRSEQEGDASVVIAVPLRSAAAEDGSRSFVGSMNMVMRVESVVAHLRDRGMLSHTLVRIYDRGPSAILADAGLVAESLLYHSPAWPVDETVVPVVERDIQAWGRTWRFEFAPEAGMLSRAERWYPSLIAAGSLGGTLLLAGVVLMLGRQRMRAQLQAAARHNLLRERTDRLNALFHQSVIGVAEIEPATRRYTSVNARFAEILGYSSEVLESVELYALVHADDRAACERMEQQLRAGEIPHFNAIQRMVCADGRTIWAEVWVSPLLSNEGKPVGRHLVLMLDVTERLQMQQQLQAREAYSSEMLRYMPVGLVVVGRDGHVEFTNQQFESMTGWTISDVADEKALWRCLCTDSQQYQQWQARLQQAASEVSGEHLHVPAAEYVLRAKSGEERSMEVSGRLIGGRLLLSLVDLTQRKQAEAQIRWLGFYDSLTQLPNRRLLLDRLGEVVQRCKSPEQGKAALLLLDIDNFKALNETLGHQHGDALLRLVATRLSNCIAGRHTLARQGGDEFAVVLEDLPSERMEAGRRAELVGGSILEALRTPFYLGAQDLHVTVSMGAVVFDGQGDTVEELLKRADLALYQAKSAGRDTLQFFDPRMQRAVSERVELEKNIRLGLERHEFDLYFQPQVQRDKVIGAEALLRWKHPVKGFIPPTVFVPVAEESGLILPLGEWVLYAACRQLAAWSRDPLMRQLTMSVNVSPRQFYQPNFVQQVRAALHMTGADPRLLELELTEGMLLTDVEDTIRKMVQLKALGVIFSLDDFGTGYSSLSYLKRLPLDKLKIDQSFVHEVLSSPNDATIARSIIALGNSLGLQVIAEGVESVAQRDFLTQSGCHYWQGFLFSKPIPGPQFEAWAQTYSSWSGGALVADDAPQGAHATG